MSYYNDHYDASADELTKSQHKMYTYFQKNSSLGTQDFP